ncbi:MAG: type I restriction enzyme HsdR N-terminal domain-containing protein, partial [Deltaproteobacteria bacterium]|nr:type I restriction enzyme HsdR N-terminal domain-containing protein [Deltaproteobacteria bacterium]
ERLRQKIARLLLGDKGHAREDVHARVPVVARAGDKVFPVAVDFVVHAKGRPAMVVRFGPGSLVTRHRPALAAARLAHREQVPVVVVTNGRDADVLRGDTGKVYGQGLAAIPSREELAAMAERWPYPALDEKRLEKEARILHAFEAVGACGCDS